MENNEANTAPSPATGAAIPVKTEKKKGGGGRVLFRMIFWVFLIAVGYAAGSYTGTKDIGPSGIVTDMIDKGAEVAGQAVDSALSGIDNMGGSDNANANGATTPEAQPSTDTTEQEATPSESDTTTGPAAIPATTPSENSTQ